MATRPPAPESTIRTRATGWLLGMLVRILTKTLRFEIRDDSELLQTTDRSVLWTFWHNRLIVVPALYTRYTRRLLPGVVLTSASRDGAVLASAMRRFGLRSVRGSSSRRGAQALVECRRILRSGPHYLAITPDGPRGPRYRLQPGIVQLARLCRVPVLPVRIEYESSWRLRSWDRFHVPKPFSRVRVHLLPFFEADDGPADAQSARLAALLQPETE